MKKHYSKLLLKINCNDDAMLAILFHKSPGQRNDNLLHFNLVCFYFAVQSADFCQHTRELDCPDD